MISRALCPRGIVQILRFLNYRFHFSLSLPSHSTHGAHGIPLDAHLDGDLGKRLGGLGVLRVLRGAGVRCQQRNHGDVVRQLGVLVQKKLGLLARLEEQYLWVGQRRDEKERRNKTGSVSA